MPELSSQVAVKPEPGLRRVLTLWDLVFYGFGHISRTGAPSHNILLIGSLSFVGAVVLNHIGDVMSMPGNFSISASSWLSWELTLRLFGNSRWLQIRNTSVAC
jgi:hypothetical protein